MSEMTKVVTRVYYGGSGKERWVFRSFLKTVSDSADVTFCGRMFHSCEAPTGKSRSLMAGRRQATTTRHGRAETPMGLNVGRLVKFISEVRWSGPMWTSINQDGQLKLDPLRAPPAREALLGAAWCSRSSTRKTPGECFDYWGVE